MRVAGVLLWFALCLFPGLTRAAPLEALLHSVEETYGGSRAVARMQSVRVEGRAEGRLRGTWGTLRRDFEAPDRLRVERGGAGGTEVRILHADRAWRSHAGGVRRIEGLPKLELVYQLLRDAVPWVFAEYRDRLVDRGRARRGGADYRLVGLPWSNHVNLTYWIDAASRRVRRVEGSLRDRGRWVGRTTEYADFRRVEEVLVPFAEVDYQGARRIGEVRVRTVRFSPPDPGPFEPARTAVE